MGIIPFLPHHTTTTFTFTFMAKLSQSISSSSSSNPLLSSILTLYILILLYFPQLFFNLIFSPLFISTLILLLTLLRLGVSQQCKQPPPPQPNTKPNIKPNLVENDQSLGGEKEVPKLECNNIVELEEPHTTLLKPDLKREPETCDPCQVIENDIFLNQSLGWAEFEPSFSPSLFFELGVGAPLEVIYEAFEGEEEGAEPPNDAFWGKNESCKKVGIMMERYPSLSRYYPESDSNSGMDSDCSSTTSLDEEEEREGLIEIALNYDYDNNGDYYDKGIINMIKKPNNTVVDYEDLHFDDEDNLIEIDISPTKHICV